MVGYTVSKARPYRILEYDPDTPHPSSVQVFAIYRLNNRIRPLDAHVRPPTTAFKQMRVSHLEVPSGHGVDHYTRFVSSDEEFDEYDSTIPDLVYCKRREKTGLQPEEDEVPWDVIDQKLIPQNSMLSFPAGKIVKLYHWPDEHITLLETDAGGWTEYRQYKVTSNHTAVTCLFRTQTQQWPLRQLTEDEETLVKDVEAEAGSDALEFWSEIDCTWNEPGNAQLMKAWHDKDFMVTAGFRLEDDGWKHHKGNLVDDEIETLKKGGPTTREKTYQLWFSKASEGDERNVLLYNKTDDRWHVVITDHPNAEFPGNPIGIQHVRYHINRTLNSGRNDARWRFKKCLKIGRTQSCSYGTDGEPTAVNKPAVKLYVLETKDGRLLDRVIVKVFRSDIRRGRNSEITRHQRFANNDQQKCIVPIRGWSQDPDFDQNMHMYIEFAPYGSLSDVVETFTREDRLIPEVFIWLTIRNLVMACSLIESFKEVHPDIKFDNIFLCEPRGPADFPAYCNPVLADFDVMCSLDTLINSDFGTHGWQTFEQLVDGYNLPVTKLHVQAIGLVAWALWCRSIHGTWTVDADSSFNDASQLPLSQDQPFPPKGDPKAYSSRLYKLIVSCMERQPADRPTLGQLMANVNGAIESLKQQRFPGIESMEENDLPEHMRLKLGGEKWPIGMNVNGTKHRISEEIPPAGPA